LILDRLSTKGRLYAFDQDPDATENIPDDPRLIFVKSNFRFLANFMDWYVINRIDGLIADLGVSSRHLDDKERGFSFRFNSQLDMRMNRGATKTATDILNNYSEEKLSDIFLLFGELRQAKEIARETVKYRKTKKIQTVNDFIKILKPIPKYTPERKFYAQTFQALRIEVNDELSALKELLSQTSDLLGKNGRIVILTYHSIEDRLVKNFLKSGNFDGKQEKDFFGNTSSPFKLVNRKVITPDNNEIQINPRSRSAKLRIAEKLLQQS
ncbi:MAG: 16S rRNA (cytosine(1402)-N(4))-methyltransferase RsmH, partial [Dysgonamonadaceae bacterium]|jgi:16S rRNA (cytosine1402-N4)-methyltransferase|nr:16S rRNA (cytosine(1402)-N(4))-methyltransferase RsmH [Dysgonamonadaceae bacterium]